MAKRWVYGTLIGLMMVGLLPAAQAQPYPDPVPIGPATAGPAQPDCPPPGSAPGPMSVDLGWPYMRYKYPPIPPVPIAHPSPYGKMQKEMDLEDEDCTL